MNHLEFAKYESNQIYAEDPWLAFVAKVEILIGHDLDGDNSVDAIGAGTADGYSIDGAYEAWRRGETAEAHAQQILKFRPENHSWNPTDADKAEAAKNGVTFGKDRFGVMRSFKSVGELTQVEAEVARLMKTITPPISP